MYYYILGLYSYINMLIESIKVLTSKMNFNMTVFKKHSQIRQMELLKYSLKQRIYHNLTNKIIGLYQITINSI